MGSLLDRSILKDTCIFFSFLLFLPLEKDVYCFLRRGFAWIVEIRQTCVFSLKKYNYVRPFCYINIYIYTKINLL